MRCCLWPYFFLISLQRRRSCVLWILWIIDKCAWVGFWSIRLIAGSREIDRVGFFDWLSIDGFTIFFFVLLCWYLQKYLQGDVATVVICSTMTLRLLNVVIEKRCFQSHSSLQPNRHSAFRCCCKSEADPTNNKSYSRRSGGLPSVLPGLRLEK